MVTSSKNQKSVLVAVFVERPRKRGLLASNNHHHHHHHHHHHLHLHQSHKHGGGSNRKADLLDYSRRLRDSAPNTPNRHHHQNKPSSVSSIIQQPINQIMAAQSKRKHQKAPSCMGNWKGFLKSLTSPSKGKKRKTNSTGTNFAATKAKVVMQSFQAHKNKGFFKKVLATIQKYR
ncbi:hypothetical protein DCAR_0206282 [Daucus carota subsp. sativus]|uniref:Uncharacterized protein n=1 Tax=Daucus carota subsp. sativus TaxID=79200 RepID=A0AAF1ANH8_DAUCS|nr:hypothetical protein DCAR_0206282 [Daucus carota subsp. sativus]